ncbi:MAG: PAS domain-containing protein [Planctomycetia bacterium]|nr:PAS domain-containing protein [Planctomycetia bacterium]
MNAAGASLLGRIPSAVEGRLDAEIFDRPTLLEEVRASDQAVLRTRRPCLYLNATRVSGAPRLFLSAKFPVADHAGQLRGIACLSRDVSGLVAFVPAEAGAQVERLVADLRAFAAVAAMGADSMAVEREDVERCLWCSTGHKEPFVLA